MSSFSSERVNFHWNGRPMLYPQTPNAGELTDFAGDKPLRTPIY